VTRGELADAPRGERAWSVERRSIPLRGGTRELRLVRFPAGWLASVDTGAGPTLGVDRSPYLAIGMAVEPLGIGLAEVMALVGPLRG
jgi:hypothetical protein